jgi:tRNA-splicing endonuclease subunit Sen2
MSSAAPSVTPLPPPNLPPDHAKPKSPRPRRPNYNYIHRNLLPLEIHPLPVLIPHNPLSLIAIALSYLTQILSTHPQPLYNGYFSSTTSSVHVTDQTAIRKLWEMGFFGRGSLSRSEPTWFESQKRKGVTSEEHTGQRRAERRQQKLDRAKKEQDVIVEKILEEIGVNGVVNANALKTNADNLDDIASVMESGSGPATPDVEEKSNGSVHGYEEWRKAFDVSSIPTPPPTSVSSETSQMNGHTVKKLQRTKTVRFSPTIEAREFDLSSPTISPIKSPGPSPLVGSPSTSSPRLENQEHLRLSLEEAFFLAYGLGVLQIFCDDSDAILPPTSLLSLFRRHSYYPPRSLSMMADPDDPFMVSYAAYHHYRSLGWVVRSGVKFSVDFLLYNRGPAFSHAEFAVVLLPSYTHSYWTETEEQRKSVEKKSQKSWWWLHSVNRVQAQVMKSLVLCYVDIPPPLLESEKGDQVDIGRLFNSYIIRDISVRRWTPNRTRD